MSAEGPVSLNWVKRSSAMPPTSLSSLFSASTSWDSSFQSRARRAYPQASARDQRLRPSTLAALLACTAALLPFDFGGAASSQPSLPCRRTQPSKVCRCAKAYSPFRSVASTLASGPGCERTSAPAAATTSKQQRPWAWYSVTARSWAPLESRTTSARPSSAPCMCESTQPASPLSFSQPFTVISQHRTRSPRALSLRTLASTFGCSKTGQAARATP
mmetsp:Transcript_125787/g.367628  ORF Transcript_125787/g.367628 Transcript_125787/m.367628 type:complete len:217 (-) Transcript_125787:419-1069(-)